MAEIRDTSSIPNRILHAMIRVADLERSKRFYCEALGMHEIRREDYPEGRFTLLFLGYGKESHDTLVELTYNYDQTEYSHGTAFGHIALAVSDIWLACRRLAALDVKITRQPGPMLHTGASNQADVIAFIEDPDGHCIELISK